MKLWTKYRWNIKRFSFQKLINISWNSISKILDKPDINDKPVTQVLLSRVRSSANWVCHDLLYLCPVQRLKNIVVKNIHTSLTIEGPCYKNGISHETEIFGRTKISRMKVYDEGFIKKMNLLGWNFFSVQILKFL